jgi:hypothetical protein
MSDNIDRFESIFRRTERERFSYVDVPIESIAIVTDLDAASAEKTKQGLLEVLPRLESADGFRFITGDQYSTVSELKERVDAEQTDLIVTYRHLQEEDLIPQHSLGVYLDVLTQTTSIPVLVLPGTAKKPKQISGRDADRVMVVADHITGDARLINYGVRVVRNGGTIWFCHVEDDKTYERYMHAIERIPEINTAAARDLVKDQLLREASLFIQDCVRELKEKGPRISFQSVVRMGHHLKQYRSLVEENQIELVVINTKDDDQLAMRGMAYSLSVEMTEVPLLLL